MANFFTPKGKSLPILMTSEGRLRLIQTVLLELTKEFLICRSTWEFTLPTVTFTLVLIHNWCLLIWTTFVSGLEWQVSKYWIHVDTNSNLVKLANLIKVSKCDIISVYVLSISMNGARRSDGDRFSPYIPAFWLCDQYRAVPENSERFLSGLLRFNFESVKSRSSVLRMLLFPCHRFPPPLHVCPTMHIQMKHASAISAAHRWWLHS